MKLSKFSKKVIAIVMALALVFVGNYFVPESTDADVTMQTLNDTNFTSIQKVYEGGNLTGEWFQTGGYESYVGYWNSSAGQAWIDSSDSDHIKVQQTSSNWWGAWAFQIRKTVTGLTSGATYTYTVNLNANKADGKYVTSSDATEVAIAAGDQTVTITGEANSSGEVTFTVGAGFIGTSVVMDFSNPVVKDSNGTQVYPEVTPTESGTETETQTETQTETETESATEPAPYPSTMTSLIPDNWTVIKEDWEEGTLTGRWFDVAGYDAYVGYWNNSAGQALVDSSDNDHIKIQQTSSNWWGPWAFQIRKTVTGLTSGATYTYTVNLNANKADGKYITSSDETQVAIAAGDQTVTITGEANSSGEVTFTVGAGYIGTSVVMDFSNPVVKDSNGTQVYPSVGPTETQTETETETQTEAPTTTKPGKPCTGYAWTFAEEDGWQYYVKNNDSTYEKGDTLANGIDINYGTYAEDTDTCQVRTPIQNVAEGAACTGSITVSNGSQYKMQNVAAAVYAYNSSTGEYSWLTNATEGTQDVEAGESTTFNFSYDAPATQKIVYIANTHYTPTAKIGFTATHSGEEPTTAAPTTTAEPTTTQAGGTCDQAVWTFAQDNGWQYYVANSDSTYFNGGTLASGLGINYGTYCEWEGTCQARTPILSVAEGAACTGSITVGCNKAIGSVTAAVYAYDSSTGDYTWYANAAEGEQAVAAGESTTFTFSYNAPATQKVVYVACTNYTPDGTVTFAATHSGEEPTTEAPTTTEAANPCVSQDWTFAATNGWQYYVANDDSTYSRGTTMAEGMAINYGTYCEWEGTCQARTPILSVTEGNECKGAITVGCDQAIGAVTAAVYAYNPSTGAYDWYANAAEGEQAVTAGGKTTFTFKYMAPATGKVVYVACTNYTPGNSKVSFSAKHAEEAIYDVSEYKSGSTYTYPVVSGYTFAGWFSDAECTTPYTGTTGNAHAKFIDENVLSTKFQEANDGTAVRMVSTLDSKDYNQVGFNFTGVYDGSELDNWTKTTTKLYKKINADEQPVVPTVFSSESTLFFTYTVRGLTAGKSLTLNVTPFFVTKDGTTVTGKSGVFNR